MITEKKKIIKYLNVATGQITGIKRMVEEDVDCIEISNQILASIALLKKANFEIIHNHLHTCVKKSLTDGDIDAKIQELEQLFKRLD